MGTFVTALSSQVDPEVDLEVNLEVDPEVYTIVPQLPPAIDGLGDYGLNLARQLRQDFGLITRFIVSRQHQARDAVIDGFPVHQLQQRTPAALLEALPVQPELCIVLLHYVGYGYAKRGCPVWLVTALEQWRRTHQQRWLITMFHEVYAHAPLWHLNSQFWTSPLQKHLAARLAQVSDRCLTSKQKYAEWLTHLSHGKHTHIPTLPVFSNVGEPQTLSPLRDRQRRLIIFGGPGCRRRAYRQSFAALEQICKELAIAEIFDLGPALDFEIAPVNGIAVKCLGIQTATEISQLLSTAIVGFFNYPLDFLAKSGIFAAYCAHQLLPVSGNLEEKTADNLVAGQHYWLVAQGRQPLNLETGQAIADHAHAWYQTHALPVQTRIFAEQLKSSKTHGSKP